MKSFPRTAALLALALAWPLAHAQAAAGTTKSFGTGKAGDKILTREELRACFAMQEQLKGRGPELEREKAQLQQEKTSLAQAGEALKAEKDTLERTREQSAAPFRAKADEHGRRIADFNRKAAELAELEKSKRQSDRAERERVRQAHDAERAQLETQEAALRTEMDTLNKANADAAGSMNARITEHEQKVRDWNTRNDAFTARVDGQRTADDRFKSECASRRYREDDEIAIRQGK